MSLVDRFNAYAEAFEVVFEKDDWSILEPYFTEDAVYEASGGPPFDGKAEGRKKVFEYLKASVDGFDRGFDERKLEMVEGPVERDGTVWLRWRVTYRVGDAPPVSMDGEETAHFEGDRICRLTDRFGEGGSGGGVEWLGRHAGTMRTAGA